MSDSLLADLASKGWKEYRRTSEKIYLEKKNPKGHIVYRIIHLTKESKYPIPEESKPPVKEKKINIDTVDIEMKDSEDKKEEKKEFKLAKTVECDRCKIEVKIPLPICNTEDCKKEGITLDDWGFPHCDSCKKRMIPIGTTCEKCTYYCPAPNETFDAGRVNFTVPLLLQKAQPATLVTMEEHELPIPQQTHEDISKDRAVNQYVFNHLPLTEDQKEALLQGLMEDQLSAGEKAKFNLLREKDNKRKEEMESMTRGVILARQISTHKSKKRKGVKDKC